MKIESNNGSKYTTLKIFMWATGLTIGFVVIVAGFLWQRIELLEVKIESYNTDVSDIKTDVATIKTDVGWIKATLESYEIIE